MQKVKFDIQGMTFSSCSSHVEKATNKLEGVKSANVNLLSNNMIVEYDESILDNNKIVQAVIDAGYGANISEEKKNSKSKEEKQDNVQDNIRTMKKRLVISICFLIPLMYISMHHMFYKWFGLPIPEFIKNTFDGVENAITFGFTRFFITTSNYICK